MTPSILMWAVACVLCAGIGGAAGSVATRRLLQRHYRARMSWRIGGLLPEGLKERLIREAID